MRGKIVISQLYQRVKAKNNGRNCTLVGRKHLTGSFLPLKGDNREVLDQMVLPILSQKILLILLFSGGVAHMAHRSCLARGRFKAQTVTAL
jgi:hypothetical protein